MRRLATVGLATLASLLGATGAAQAVVVDIQALGQTSVPVRLTPSFVVPSAVDQGDEVVFDSSTTTSTLIVPAAANYQWDFGDGTTATGPSVVHSFAQAGTYTVKLATTDRGANQQTPSQTIQVLGPNGEPVPPAMGATPPAGGSGSGSGSPPQIASPFAVRLLLMPQSKHAVLHRGLSLRVTSNQTADGYATVTITRAQARRAGIRTGPEPFVVVGRGTVTGVQNGTAPLRLRLAKTIADKLARIHRLVLTVHLVLIAPGGTRTSYDVAGRY